MSYAIEVDGLKKSYDNHTVLKGLSFSVNEGEIFALLGVNGAGKRLDMRNKIMLVTCYIVLCSFSRLWAGYSHQSTHSPVIR